MVAASESLTTHNAPATASKRQPWKPSGDAHLVYHWVKMEGKSQGWVAAALNISQPTVSRIVQRYERWQAHAKDRENGRLDPTERLRAQRWQTFERNELILTSCLRIAGEMEGFIDTSKSTIRRPTRSPSQESEILTQHAPIDRTGMAARFLRLAFKINMEQLKLAELASPPPAVPLSDEELAEEERQALADAAELAEARRRYRDPDQMEGKPDGKTEGPSDSGSVGCAHHDAPANETVGEARPTTDAARDTENDFSTTPDAAAVNNMHNLHTENQPEMAATAGRSCSCTRQLGAAKNRSDACIADVQSPRAPDLAIPMDPQHDLATQTS